MRLLLVEDDPDDLEVLEREIRKIRPVVELLTATARDTALNTLSAECFDLIVCDLRIPTDPGALDAEVAHGRAVVDAARSTHPGTPILILSAFADLDYAEELISYANQEDIFGASAPFPLLSFIQKKRMPECIDRVRECSAHIQQLDDIVFPDPTPPDLTPSEKRIIRIFARRLGGTIVSGGRLSGGLSGATVLRIRVLNARSDVMADAIAKIAIIADILDEDRRCGTCVTPILRPGDFAPIADRVLAGASAYGGLFYSVAQGDRSLFEVLAEHPDRAPEVVARLEALEQPWLQNAPTDSVRVHDLRGRLLAGDCSVVLDQHLNGFDWRSFEDRSVMVRTARQHGDLHPGNIVVRPDFSPTLVDFGRVDVYSAALDPISLELALLFHPSARHLVAGWPSLEDAALWPDIESFTLHCPIAGFVRACRSWALRASTSARECHAVAYAVALRQFKFEGTDHAIASRIALAAASAFNS